MKTIKARPVLVESKDNENRQHPCILKHSYEFGDPRGKIGFYDSNIKRPTIAMELILISLEDGKIENGDSWIGHKTRVGKVIATQSQLSPEYISKFVDEYNSDCVKDLEIETWCGETNCNYTSRQQNCFKANLNQIPKLTSGFVTIVEKEYLLTSVDGVKMYSKEDMRNAYNAGARNGSRAGMRVAKGGELCMKGFEDWFNSNKKK